MQQEAQVIRDLNSLEPKLEDKTWTRYNNRTQSHETKDSVNVCNSTVCASCNVQKKTLEVVDMCWGGRVTG